MAVRKRVKVDYKYNIREYWSFLKKYKFKVAILFLVVLYIQFSGFVDRYLFKYLVDYSTNFVAKEITREYYVHVLLIIASIFLIFLFTNMIFDWLRAHYLNLIDANVMFDLKKKYFSHILHLDYSFHVTHKTGSMISRISRGTGAIERMTDSFIFDFLPLFLQFGIAVVALYYVDLLSAGIIFVVMVLFIGFNYLMQKISDPYKIYMNRKEDKERGSMADFFTNIESIRNFGKEKYILNKYVNLSNATREAQLATWNYQRITGIGQGIILSLGTLFLIYFSILKFLDGQITIGTLTFIYTTYGALMGPMYSFVGGIRNFSRSMADFQELFAYGKIEKDVKDSQTAKDINITRGEVEFENIEFGYSNRKLFKNFNLKISPNKKVALVGHSGCGKTSLIRLIYRLRDVENGRILIDGQNICDVKQESLRSEMSIVPQECVLFDDTIYNNILFSKPEATRKEVLAAMKFAQLDKFVDSLQDKENTIVGERGVKLSGGEKQRVSIARAILANKKILILDEATSALDSETEYEIQRDLKKLMEGRTSIIIAHRLSTIMHADEIVVMEKGKIVQRGKHSKLISQPGQYRKLWNLQKGGYIKD